MLQRIANWSEFLQTLDEFEAIVWNHWDSEDSADVPSRLSTVGLQLADWISTHTPHDPAPMLELMRAIQAKDPLGHMRAFHVSVEEVDRLRWRWWPIKELLIDAAISGGAESHQGHAGQFVPNDFQRRILEELNGKALKKQALADAVCGGEGSRLYSGKRKRKGDLNELRDRGLVEHKHQLGYYRPDAPPVIVARVATK